jgi:hypothetical protein
MPKPRTRRAYTKAGKAELNARAAMFGWFEKCMDGLQATTDPDVILKIATAMSKVTAAQMKVRQVKGRDEEDGDSNEPPVEMGVADLQELILSKPVKGGVA